MKIKEILAWSISELSDFQTPRLDAELIIADILKEERLYVMINPDKQLTDKETTNIKANILLRKSNYPIHYILKKREFMGMDFEVEPDVLIPRPDTEILVEQAIYEISKRKKHKILNEKDIINVEKDDSSFQYRSYDIIGMEIGSGSGIISISLLKNIKELYMVAVDINDKALELTKKNAIAHNVDKRLDIRKSDLFEEVKDLKGNLDFIISNPPYIQRHIIDMLSEEIKSYEPHNALDGGDDGLDFYKAIIISSGDFLKQRGFIAFEIGYDQAFSVQNLLLDEGFSDCKVVKDIAGLDRVVIAYKI